MHGCYVVLYFSIDDELLAGDEEYEGDYDLQDVDENALLDDNFEVPQKNKGVIKVKPEFMELMSDVLELEEEVELPDEETEGMLYIIIIKLC